MFGVQAMDMACWGLIPRFWVKDKGFKEDDAVWGDKKLVGADAPPPATELREGPGELMEQHTSRKLKHHQPFHSSDLSVCFTEQGPMANFLTRRKIFSVRSPHLMLCATLPKLVSRSIHASLTSPRSEHQSLLRVVVVNCQPRRWKTSGNSISNADC